MPPEILTTAELAARLKADPETIRRMTRSGQLPHLRVGNEYRYEWVAVLAATQIQLDPVPVPRDLLARIIQHADDPRKQMSPGVGAPNHTHREPGKRDENGGPCLICADWNQLRALLGAAQ